MSDGMNGINKPSNCMTAPVTARIYKEIVDGKLCNGGSPCMRDECEHCGQMNRLIDILGGECEMRGCTLRHCVFD